jgi:hypothetical protein
MSGCICEDWRRDSRTDGERQKMPPIGSDNRRLARSAYLLAAFVLFAALIAFRRPVEFVHPGVWDEDGTHNLPDYILYGIGSLARPVSGYLIVVPKLITMLSAKISFVHYPLVANIIATVFEAFVLVCICVCPTYLRWRFVCALAVALVPTDPEVFVLPLYTFWFAGLLAVLAVLWRTTASSGPLMLARYAFVVLGGLSSPLIVPLAPLFVVRAVVQRQREWIPAALAVLCAATQMLVLHGTHMLEAITPVSQLVAPNELIAVWLKYFGGVAAYSGPEALMLTTHQALGLTFGATVVVTGVAALNRDRVDRTVWVLVGLYVLAIGLSVARVPASATTPYEAGPRYFFYPFIFMAWALINLAAVSGRAGAIALGVLLCATAAGSLMRFQRNSQPLNWVNNVVACSQAPGASYTVPIHFNGDVSMTWKMTVKPADCLRLRRESLYRDKKAWRGP